MLKRRWKWLVLAALGLAVLIAPCVLDPENKSLSAAERSRVVDAGLAYSFITLSDGETHYQLTGPADAKATVVLIHGTSGPMGVWDESVAPLVDAGFRVLRYDFFGRGYSDRSSLRYDLETFTRQLDDLVQRLVPRGPIVLMGSSLGCIVAADYAAKQATSKRIAAVVLVGPAGFRLQASILAKLAKAPYVGDYIMRVVGHGKLVAHHRRYFDAPHKFEAYHRAFARQLRYRGSKRAILNTLRRAPLQSFSADGGFGRLGATNIPVLLVWGRNDRVFPFVHHKALLEAVPHATFLPVDDTGHLPQLERPEVVAPRVVSFINGLGVAR